MKVLITGSQGQLGKELLKNIPDDIEVIPSDRKTFNLLDLKNCREFIFDNKPDWIINAAAYTAVDLAEDEQDRALLINSEAPTEIAEALKKTGGKLLHISTDFVFDGESSSGSSINAKELKTKECLVDASSGGNIDIYNEGSIKADVSSGGNIDYYGKPEKVSTKKSISGGSIDYKKD